MKAPSTHMPDTLDEALLLIEQLRTQNERLVEQTMSLHRQLEKADEEHAKTRMFISAIDQCSESIFFTDVKGHILFVNRSFEKISGFSREELLGRTPRMLKSGIHDKDFYRQMWETILRGEIWRSRMTNRRKDGTLYHEEANITPVRNDAGEITSFVSVKNDITELLQNKQALEEANAELSRSNLELEQFAYVASHDLQEPLRAVSSCMQLLEKRLGPQLDERSIEYIRHAVDACRRMRDLIDGLLTLSRVQTTAGLLEPTDTRHVLHEVCVNVAQALDESGGSIKLGELPTVCAHPQMLLHLFQNLISNAIKFAGKNSPVIQIDARPRNEFWIFSVRDEGIGIEEVHFDRIFQLFQRLHTRDEYPGTGLGLPICKKIIDHHGGEIWVESTPGSGSTFYFTLPAVPADGSACHKNPTHTPR